MRRPNLLPQTSNLEPPTYSLSSDFRPLTSDFFLLAARCLLLANKGPLGRRLGLDSLLLPESVREPLDLVAKSSNHEKVIGETV